MTEPHKQALGNKDASGWARLLKFICGAVTCIHNFNKVLKKVVYKVTSDMLRTCS